LTSSIGRLAGGGLGLKNGLLLDNCCRFAVQPACLWTEYLGVSRPTVHAWIKQYNLVNKDKHYDPRKIISILRFLDFLRDAT
jgi:hypothetical protein